MSLREAIEAAISRDPVPVELPWAKSKCLIRRLGSDELLALWEKRDDAPEHQQHAYLVAECVTDESGVHVWDSTEPADIEAICALSGYAHDLHRECLRVNGLLEAQAKALVGNSEEADGG